MNGNLTPFERATPTIQSFDDWFERHEADIRRAYPHTGDDAILRMARVAFDRLMDDELWKNDEYQVAIDKNPPHMFGDDTTLWHLSIKRIGKTPIHDWRDLQAIKNTLVGPDYEAVELYPSSKRTVDGANQYHLWVFIRSGGVDNPILPFGWNERTVSSQPFANGKQRKLHMGGETL